jgi:hypothetical protein
MIVSTMTCPMTKHRHGALVPAIVTSTGVYEQSCPMFTSVPLCLNLCPLWPRWTQRRKWLYLIWYQPSSIPYIYVYLTQRKRRG